jgi:Heat shock protein
MKKNGLAVALVVGITVLSGCNKSNIISETDLLHHRFVLIKANNDNISSENQLELVFGENMNITGKMCNHFSSQVSLKDGIIKGSAIAMTKMLCNDEQLDKLDLTIKQLISKGAHISLNKDQLILKNDNDKLIYQLKDLM